MKLWLDAHFSPALAGWMSELAFDPRRVAILLIAGDKTGDERWYEVFVPRADELYDEHLKILEEEVLI